jgi:hypothetical protein
VYRNCVAFDLQGSCQTLDGYSVAFIGDAAFLAGARPDVETAYSTFPQNYRAGWGLLVLTNLLPHGPLQNPAGGGQGPITFYAFATDLEGRRTLLGTKQITLNNDNATVPFGAIDTPGQGGTIAGAAYANFGWALTPGSALVPVDGSTLSVVVDGAPVGTVAYNQCRGTLGPDPGAGMCNDDVAQLFPNASNIQQGSGAIGVFMLDTTALPNGVHTIAWGVTDSLGRQAGIGSRYFTVLNQFAELQGNPLADEGPRSLGSMSADIAWRSPGTRRVAARTGFNFAAPFQAMAPDATGVHHVQLPELGRLEIDLGAVDAGYLRAGDALRPLPAGSQLDPATGRFTWLAGAGFVGRYDLVFVRGTVRLLVQVTIG